MDTNFSIDKRKNILTVKCTGRYNFDTMLQLIESAKQICYKENLQKVWVDGLEVIDGDIPAHERYYIGEALANQWHYEVKAIFLFPEKWINKLVETVANNRGANIFCTHSVEFAEQWLFSSEEE